MKRKSLLSVVLALILCFSVIFAAGAAQLTAKDLVVGKIKSLNLGVNQGFYEKSQAETLLKVNKFNGSLTKDLGNFNGAAVDLLSQLDAANNTIKIGYTTNIKGKRHKGDIYLKDNQVIVTKDILYVLQELGIDVFKDNPALAQGPPYLYLSDEQLKTVWEQLTGYQNKQLPKEYQELLLFLVEAVPDQYFSISPTKVTLKLDQQGLEAVIYDLLLKVKNEKERAADILVGLNKNSTGQMGISPEKMKQEIISDLENFTVPSQAEIHLASNFVTVKDFTYESAVLPGGPNNFNLNLNLNAPDGSTGQLTVAVNSAGKQDNLKGSYRIAGNYTDSTGSQYNAALACKFGYSDTNGYSNTALNVTAKDNKTGELILDLNATANSTAKTDKNLTLKVPELTAANSMNITPLMQGPGIPAKELNLKVNGNYIESGVKPYLKDKKYTMVPVRAAAEALGCKVTWSAPDQVNITNKDKVISLLIGQDTYKVDGAEKKLELPAYIEAGYTMAPVSFIVNEFGAVFELVGEDVVITQTKN